MIDEQVDVGGRHARRVQRLQRHLAQAVDGGPERIGAFHRDRLTALEPDQVRPLVVGVEQDRPDVTGRTRGRRHDRGARAVGEQGRGGAIAEVEEP